MLPGKINALVKLIDKATAIARRCRLEASGSSAVSSQVLLSMRLQRADSDGLRTGFRRKPDSVPMIADSR